MTRKNITSLVIVVVIGLLLQAGFVALDSKETPADTAVSFARAYYQLSPSMVQWMYGTSSATCGKSGCNKESASCSKAASGNKTARCPKAIFSKESVRCPKAVSGYESARCLKAVSGKESVRCPKVASGNESARRPKVASGTKSAPCPKTACDKQSEHCSKAACGNASARCVNTAVEEYLYEAGADVAKRGFGINFAKYTLSHIETRSEYLDGTTALVHLTAHRRLVINPLYAYVARLFRIGDTYEVDESIQVKLENGRWRVSQSSLLSPKTS